jgi:thioredoxin-related protein
MKKALYLSVFLLAGFSFKAVAQTGTEKKDTLVWYTELNTVYEISKSTNKPIFAFFTGSDWCGWCHKLQKDVFAKQEFIDWASKNVVLLELDFPRRKQLSPELVAQNNSLQQTFGIRGYPTIWMFFTTKDEATNNFNINALGSLGYPQGAEVGKEEVKFLSDANLILANAKSK